MDARLEILRGRPRLIVDGVSLPPLAYSTSVLSEREVRRFVDCGVRVISFPATADFHLYGLAKTVWTGPDSYDFSELDARMDLVSRAHPDALVLLRVMTCSPPWWDERYPADLVHWDDGSTDRPLLHGALKARVASLASPRRRADMSRNVERLVTHLEHGPHKNRIVGYMINSGNSEEWFHFGLMEGYLFDYNPAMTRRFRDWLKDRYETDDRLANAWGRAVDLRSAEIPGAATRRAHDGQGFRHPIAQRDVVDFAQFFGDLTAETISDLAATLKSVVRGKKLFGTFYGYMTELAYHPDGIQNSGHLGLAKILADRNVDFLASPSSYARRMPASGYSMSMVPSATLEAEKKVFFHENDLRTHVLFDDAGYGRTDSGVLGCALQRRELAHALVHGHGMWWFDMTSGWYDDPQLEETIRRAVAIVDRAGAFERESCAEIALVVDEDSMPSVTMDPARLVQLINQQCLELSRCGAPFDVVLLRDLERLGNRKLLLFPNLFLVDEKKRRFLHDRIRSTGATAVFLFAPGMIDGVTIDVKNVEKTVKIGLQYPEAARFMRAVATVDGRPLTFGTHFWWGRAPIVADEEAVPIARSAEDGAVMTAKKTVDGMSIVFSAAPALPGALLRKIANDAGCRLFLSTDDAVYADNRFFALHARTAGKKRIVSPKDSVLYDLVHFIEIIGKEGVFSVYAALGDTLLFFRGTAEEWGAADAVKTANPAT
jgi:hypothetical protein